MRKLYILLFISTLAINLHAQKREGAVWVVGANTVLDWNSGELEIKIKNHNSYTQQTAVMCDANGNLRFYSNGFGILDRTFQHFLGIPTFYASSYSGVNGISTDAVIPLILDQPKNINKYYMVNLANFLANKGLHVHKVDMEGNNGFGSLELSPINLSQGNMPFLTAMLHADESSYWIVTRKNGVREWNSFLVNDTGIVRTPVVSITGPDYPTRPNSPPSNAIEYMGVISSSPNSEYFVTNNHRYERDSNLVLYNFNRATGISTKLFSIHFPVKIFAPAFSSNSQVLYAFEANKSYHFSTPSGQINSHARGVYQVDISSLDSSTVQNSITLVGNSSVMGSPTASLALDGKIYLGDAGLFPNYKLEDSLDVINFPNQIGINCALTAGFKTFISGQTGLGVGRGFPFLNKTVFRNTWKLQASPSEDTCCMGDTVTLYAYGAEANTFVWDQHPQLLQTSGPAVKALATAPFTAWVTGSNPFSSNRASVTVEVVPKPVQPIISWTQPNAVSVMNPTPNTHYEWMEDGLLVRNNTSTRQVATPAKRYQVRAKGQAQCWSAWSQQIITSKRPDFDLARLAKVYPNPARDVLHIDLPNGQMADEMILTDMLGRQVIQQSVKSVTADMDVSRLSRGSYFLQVRQAGVVSRPVKVLVQ